MNRQSHSLTLQRLSFPGPIASLIADVPPLIVNCKELVLGEGVRYFCWQSYLNFVEIIRAFFDKLCEMKKKTET